MPMTHFRIIEDFDGQSANGAKCYLSNLSKQKRRTPQQQDHEIDEFILRGPAISFEGYMDIRPAVIIETATELLGMLSPASAAALEAEKAELHESNLALMQEVADLRQRCDVYAVAQAEMIQQMQALELELGQAYDDIYDDEESHASLEALKEAEHADEG